MFRMRVYREEGEVLLAASDEDVVGETLQGEGVSLSVEASFYGEEVADAETVLRQLRTCTMANLVGEEVVALAVEHGHVDPDSVAEVGGVPHAQLAQMRER